MSDLIRPRNYVVVQKAPGGMSPRLQLLLLRRFGPEGLQQQQQRQVERDERVRARVYAERAWAVSLGVQVVVDETRPDHYTLAELPDEGPNSGT